MTLPNMPDPMREAPLRRQCGRFLSIRIVRRHNPRLASLARGKAKLRNGRVPVESSLALLAGILRRKVERAIIRWVQGHAGIISPAVRVGLNANSHHRYVF